MAGFEHLALVELESDYCDCLRANRPEWNVICEDVRNFDGHEFRDRTDLLAGGVPCPPFSHAGKRLGADDDRDLFPEMIRLVKEISPKAVMIENVRGLLDPKFDTYRDSILRAVKDQGYDVQIRLLHASWYGVPQLRPRVIIIGIRSDITEPFIYPSPTYCKPPTVGEILFDLISERGWTHADEWRTIANDIAPTLVGGSRKHGGPDLGPTRARNAWAKLGVDGRGVANEAPEKDFVGSPRLTYRMLARLQGFPDSWDFGRGKTKACRMIGNAFPPPVAAAVGKQIINLLHHEKPD